MCLICPFSRMLTTQYIYHISQQWESHLKEYNIHRNLYSTGSEIYVGSNDPEMVQKWIIFIFLLFCILLKLSEYIKVRLAHTFKCKFLHPALSLLREPLLWIHSCKIVCQQPHIVFFTSEETEEQHQELLNYVFFNLKAYN